MSGEKDEICKKCNGTGWEKVKKNTVRRCECVKKKLLFVATQRAGMPLHFAGFSLSGYQPQTPSQEAAKKKAARFIADLPTNQKGLFFSGPPGVGKTALSCAILREAIRLLPGMGLLYLSYLEFARSMRGVKEQGYAMINEVADAAKKAFILVFDDLFCDRPSAWIVTVLLEIFDFRYTREFPTILSSNLTFPEIEEALLINGSSGPAAFSRIVGMTERVQIVGPDRRKEHAV